MKFIFSIILTITLLAGCNSVNKGSHPDFPKQFPYPTIPSIITSENDAGIYVATHFWNNYFDSLSVWGEEYPDSLIGGIEENTFREAAVQYVLTLWPVPEETAEKSLDIFVRKCESIVDSDKGKDTYKKIMDLFEFILYNPISDFRNEDFYIPLIESRLHTGLTDSIPLDTYQFQLDKCSMNRKGDKADDFAFTTIDGKKHHLYEIKEDYTLLMFTNPGCPACRQSVSDIKNDELLAEMVKNNKLKLLNIYIDEDLDAWKRYLGDYPEEWMSGYDHRLALRDGDSYNIRAIPSIYLLNKEKKVLYKDVSLNILIPLLRINADNYLD